MEEIVKRHSPILSEVFHSQEDLNAHEQECAKYKEEFNEILDALRGKNMIAHIRGGFGTFCPHIQHFSLDALDKEDHPNGISENSIYVRFTIDFKERKFEIRGSGHIWLTDEDKRKSYLCMCSVRDASEAMGGKWMRKSKFRSAEDLANKVAKFWAATMENVTKATGGYPYKQMIVNIY